MTYNMEWLLNKPTTEDDFEFFWGHKGKFPIGKHCLSQWFYAPFVVDGVVYPTAEHWMMAKKALLFADNDTFHSIIATESPKDVKSLGRTIKGFSSTIWDVHKMDIVKEGNLLKFQDPSLRDYLLSTENKILVEASPYDTIWGIGISVNQEEIFYKHLWRGENLLGFILMEVRDLLSK